MTIRRFDYNANTSDVVAALDLDGAALIQGQVDVTTADLIGDELRNCFVSRSDAGSLPTVTTAGLFANSGIAVELMAHPRVVEVADAVLLRFCSNYQLGAAIAIEMPPGGEAQALQADGAIYPIRLPGVEWQIGAMWALDDVDEDNGAPQFIPGSHRGDKMRRPDPDDAETVPMGKGSVMLRLGWAAHGLVANRSDISSRFLVYRYSLGWLRSELHHLFSVSEETRERCPEKVRLLLAGN